MEWKNSQYSTCLLYYLLLLQPPHQGFSLETGVRKWGELVNSTVSPQH